MVVGIVLAVADVLHQLGGRVENVGGRHQRSRFPCGFPCGLLRGVGSIRFGCGGAVQASLHHGEFPFGRAKEFIGILGRKALNQRLRIGKADVLAGKAHQPAQHVKRFFPGGEHPGEVIECSLRIGTAQRFMQRRDQVVMPVAVLVVNRHTPHQELRQVGGIERLCKVHIEQGFRLIEQEPPVAIRRSNQCVARIRCEGQGASHDRLGAVQQLIERAAIQPVKDQDLRPR